MSEKSCLSHECNYQALVKKNFDNRKIACQIREKFMGFECEELALVLSISLEYWAKWVSLFD
jgi:hypothetical protein